MSVININWYKNSVKYIEDADDLSDILADFMIEVDGIPIDKYIVSEYSYDFFKILLSHFYDLFNGKKVVFDSYEGPFEMVFEPINDDVEIYLHFLNESDRKEYGEKKFAVPKKYLVKSLIKVANEYFDFILGKRPDLYKNNVTVEFIELIADARAWYRKTYDEVV